MKYSFDIFDKTPERLMRVLADNCKKRRLERGMSRRTMAEHTMVPAPSIERFENTGQISLESFCKIVIELDYFDEMMRILSEPKFTTGEELKIINSNLNRIKGR